MKSIILGCIALVSVLSLPNKFKNIIFYPTHMKIINVDEHGTVSSVIDELDSCRFFLKEEVLQVYMDDFYYEIALTKKRILADNNNWVCTYKRKFGMSIIDIDIYITEDREIELIEFIYPTNKRVRFYQKLKGT
jgi:hypothetical protein